MLSQLLKNKNYVNILDTIMRYQTDFSKEELWDDGVSKRHMKSAFDTFEKLGVIVYTRGIGQRKMYKFNTDSSISRAIISLDTEIDRHE